MHTTSHMARCQLSKLLKTAATVTTASATAPSLTHTWMRRSKLNDHYNEQKRKKSPNLPHHLHYSTNTVTFENQPPSWLFVSDAVAGAYGAQVNLDLDLDTRLSDDELDQLKSNLRARGMEFELDRLVEDLKTLRQLEKEKNDLLEQKDSLVSKLKQHKGYSEEIKTLRQNVKNELSEVKKKLDHFKQFQARECADLEESVIVRALKLPNDLHKTTPLTSSAVIKEAEGKTAPTHTTSHVEIAEHFDLIKFSNVGPKAFYLKGELAMAEMAVSETVCQYLRSKSYRHMAGPEFFKTPIMEGCGRDIHDANEEQHHCSVSKSLGALFPSTESFLVCLKGFSNHLQVFTMLSSTKGDIEPMNHLAGVSPAMFVAYVAKTSIGDNSLPLKMFACGRRYENGTLPGLFGPVQSTQAGIFSCVSRDAVDNHYEETVNLIWEFLQPLGFQLQTCQIPATQLRREERRRTEIQMFAPSLGQFIPVGSVSDLGDYVSRRLMVTHNQNHADIRHGSLVHMVSGTAVNITSFLAVWMEHSKPGQESFSLCELPGLKKPS